MKSVSKIIPRVLSSRALSFFLFRPTDLKKSWCLLLRQRLNKQKLCNFLSKPLKSAENTLPERAALTTMHPSPKGQTWAQSYKSAFEMFPYTMHDAGEQREWTWKYVRYTASRNTGLPWKTQQGAAAWLLACLGGMGFGLWAGVSWPLPAERLHMDSGCLQNSQKGFGGMMSMPQLNV